MIKSMTAFGRGEASSRNALFVAEIHSVNRKHFEMTASMPREMLEMEPQIRRLVSERIKRGKVSYFLDVRWEATAGGQFKLNVERAQRLRAAYEALQKELGYPEGIDFSTLVRLGEVVTPLQHPPDATAYWEPIREASERALEAALAMKRAEGQALRDDFVQRLDAVESIVPSIAEHAPEAVERYREKLRERIALLKTDYPDDEERILREVMLYADRVDITEEIVRLKSHLEQFRGFLDKEDAVGRTLDFLTQEMQREMNTIGAKSLDVEISNLVVRGRTEIEKIREQVQNVE